MLGIWVLLAVGVAAFLLTAIGMLLARDVYERIQYTYPAATIGIAAIVAAIVIHKSISQAGIKAILTCLVVFWMSPALSHATARAGRVRRFGHWTPGDKENIQVTEDPK